MNPPEPKGVIPLHIKADTKMESIMQNYKKDAEMENEMDMIMMGNYDIKMELIKKMLMNWRIVMKENRREEERYKEEYEKGIRRKKGLEEIDVYFKRASEEMNKIEEEIAKKRKEGKVEVLIDADPVYYDIEKAAYIVYARITNEEEIRNGGDRDYVSY